MNPSTHPIVSREQWTIQRLALLAREKELTRQRDDVARERRAMPWVRSEKDYVFDTAAGPRRLAELFGGHSQLVLQHFMFAPGWEQGCKSCSFMADHVDAARVHLAHRDLGFVAVSRAPLADIERFRRRMGWQFDWVSSHGSDFNRDFGVSFTQEELASGKVPYNYTLQSFGVEEAPGISVFFKDEDGSVFHTYSTYGRGVELMMGSYDFLDIAPRGRDEDQGRGMAWVRHHDRYEPAPAAPKADGCCEPSADRLR